MKVMTEQAATCLPWDQYNILVNIIMESSATYLCTLAITNIYIVNVTNYMPTTTQGWAGKTWPH